MKRGFATSVLVIFFSGLGLISISCGNDAANVNKSESPGKSPAPGTPRPEAPKVWANLPSLANKTPEEVESMAGKHVTLTPITEPPQEVPGEYRTYDLPDMKEALSVRFYKGKAVAFTVNVPKGKEFKTAQELGDAVGFDVKGKPAAKATEFMSQWNGQFGTAKFAEITIGKTATTNYNLVRARIQQ